MTLSLRPFIGFIAASLVVGSALAQGTPATNASTTTAPEKKAWGLNIGVTRSTSLIDFQDGSRKDGMDYSLAFNYKLNEKFNLSASGGYAQDLKYPESNDISDIMVTASRSSQALNKFFTWTYKGSATLPTSKDSYKRQNLITSLAGGLGISINPDLLITGLNLSGGTNFGRNIHQYETALDGRVNAQYVSTQYLAVGYLFEFGLSLSAQAVHKNTWSYQNVMRDGYELSQEIGYEVSPMWSVALGHSNAGSSLKPNGYESNVEFLNENNSVVYGSVSASF